MGIGMVLFHHRKWRTLLKSVGCCVSWMDKWSASQCKYTGQWMPVQLCRCIGTSFVIVTLSSFTLQFDWTASQWSTSQARRELSGRCYVLRRDDEVMLWTMSCMFDCCIQEAVLLVTIVYYICPCFVLTVCRSSLSLNCFLFNFVLIKFKTYH